MVTKEGNQIALRPVRPEDEEFIYAVYASTRAEEMAVIPWTDEQREGFLRAQFAAQQRHYQSHFPQATHQMITLDGRPIGRLYADRWEQEIRIHDIAILTEYRGHGIGGLLLRQLLSEAGATNRRLTIYVESFNRSRTLFERLGFIPVEETGVHLLFEWRCDNRPPAGEAK